jgi:hypothetical protein
VQVLPKDAKKDDETYVGWFCECTHFIAIDPSWSESVRILDEHHVKAVCPCSPQCPRVYQGTWGERKTIRHAARPQGRRR